VAVVGVRVGVVVISDDCGRLESVGEEAGRMLCVVVLGDGVMVNVVEAD